MLSRWRSCLILSLTSAPETFLGLDGGSSSQQTTTILWRCFVTANGPLVYADACVFLEVLQQTNDRWRDSLKILLAAERGDIQLLASRLLAVEVGRFRGDANRVKVDELVLKYLESVNAQWAEVDLLISRQARELSWKFEIKSGADAIHLATAVRFRADYFMSRDGGFPYGQTIESTSVTNPRVVWTPSLFDAEVDNQPGTNVEPRSPVLAPAHYLRRSYCLRSPL